MNWSVFRVSSKTTWCPIQIFKKREEKKKHQTHTISTKKAQSKIWGSCSLGESCCYWYLKDTCWVLMEEKGSPNGLYSDPRSAPEPDVPFPTHDKCEVSAWSPSSGLWGERVRAGCSSWGLGKTELPSFYPLPEWDLEHIQGNSCLFVVKGFKWWQNEAILLWNMRVYEGS